MLTFSAIGWRHFYIAALKIEWNESRSWLIEVALLMSTVPKEESFKLSLVGPFCAAAEDHTPWTLLLNMYIQQIQKTD